MIHGGSEEHWRIIETIAKEYKLGKNQTGSGRFTGKDVRLEEDGSITINQTFYVDEEAVINPIPIAGRRKQQRYSRCAKSEVEQLRSQLGVLSWLAKETRCDLAGRVAPFVSRIGVGPALDMLPDKSNSTSRPHSMSLLIT